MSLTELGSPRSDSPEERLRHATGRAELDDAMAWIADGYPLIGDDQRILRDLAAMADSRERQRAAQTLTRRLSQSTADSAAILFRLNGVRPATAFRRAIDHLASRTRDRTLRTTDARAVLAAQREEPFTVETLCAVAGLSFSDLKERAAGIPSDPRGPWTPGQIGSAFSIVNAIVTGSVSTSVAEAEPMRPLELIPALGGETKLTGWAQIEYQRTRGVPYEVLLAQRVAGGAWLAHRNSTSGLLNHQLAQRLVDGLAVARIGFLRATNVGGDDPPRHLQDRAGCDGQIGLLAINRSGRPAYAVAFSSARDSGTASKSAARLLTMKRDALLPMAVLVSGPGWSSRNETATLAMSFGGRLFSDQAIDALVSDIKGVLELSTGRDDGDATNQGDGR